jgi:hypothetical protein
MANKAEQPTPPGLQRSLLPVKLSIMAWSLAVSVVALAAYAARTSAVATNSATSLTLLYQNNLNSTDDSNHVGKYYDLKYGEWDTNNMGCV